MFVHVLFQSSFRFSCFVINILFVNCISVLSGVRDVRNLIVTHVQGSGHGIPGLFHIRQRSRAVFKVRDFGIHILLGSRTCVSSRSLHSQVRAGKVVSTSNGVTSVLNVGKCRSPVFQVCDFSILLRLRGFERLDTPRKFRVSSVLYSLVHVSLGRCICVLSGGLDIQCAGHGPTRQRQIPRQVTRNAGNLSLNPLDSSFAVLHFLLDCSIQNSVFIIYVLLVCSVIIFRRCRKVQCTGHGITGLFDIRHLRSSVRQICDFLFNSVVRFGTVLDFLCNFGFQSIVSSLAVRSFLIDKARQRTFSGLSAFLFGGNCGVQLIFLVGSPLSFRSDCRGVHFVGIVNVLLCCSICISGRGSNINGSAGEVESPSAGIAATFQIGQVNVTRLNFVQFVIDTGHSLSQRSKVLLQGVDGILHGANSTRQVCNVLGQIINLRCQALDGGLHLGNGGFHGIQLTIDLRLKIGNLLGHVAGQGIDTPAQGSISIFTGLLFVVDVCLENGFCILSALRLSGNQAVQAIFLQSSAVDFIGQVTSDFILPRFRTGDFFGNLFLQVGFRSSSALGFSSDFGVQGFFCGLGAGGFSSDFGVQGFFSGLSAGGFSFNFRIELTFCGLRAGGLRLDSGIEVVFSVLCTVDFSS